MMLTHRRAIQALYLVLHSFSLSLSFFPFLTDKEKKERIRFVGTPLRSARLSFRAMLSVSRSSLSGEMARSQQEVAPRRTRLLLLFGGETPWIGRCFHISYV